ncbi:fumarylacetoacetate hydrolase family protein [Kribbella sp. NPDC056861]|uniref:fumarylacetoacetate hydrolase family protein n=1 Tax=Kribbella sp. NPDC056861 TaxID=3154857 RepID=UPI00341D3869
MKWATYRSAVDGQEHAALYDDGLLHALRGERQLIDLIGSPEALTEAAREVGADPLEVVSADTARLLAPIPRPPSVRDFMAFENHYVTSMNALGLPTNPVYYRQPVFYFQNPVAIQGPSEPVPIAPGSRQFDYELEVAAIVGPPASNVTPAEASAHIAGYTILCDWSARDLQAAEMTMSIGPGKAKDTATSLGPFLVTPDELEGRRGGRGFDVRMTAAVNGVVYSEGNWADQFWSFTDLLSYASRGTTLRTGDIIGAGTVGTGCILELGAVHGAEAYPWLEIGDQVTLRVEGLGQISTSISPGAPVHPLNSNSSVADRPDQA